RSRRAMCVSSAGGAERAARGQRLALVLRGLERLVVEGRSAAAVLDADATAREVGGGEVRDAVRANAGRPLQPLLLLLRRHLRRDAPVGEEVFARLVGVLERRRVRV